MSSSEGADDEEARLNEVKTYHAGEGGFMREGILHPEGSKVEMTVREFEVHQAAEAPVQEEPYVPKPKEGDEGYVPSEDEDEDGDV